MKSGPIAIFIGFILRQAVETKIAATETAGGQEHRSCCLFRRANRRRENFLNRHHEQVYVLPINLGSTDCSRFPGFLSIH
jgi:hypothetical protein